MQQCFPDVLQKKERAQVNETKTEAEAKTETETKTEVEPETEAADAESAEVEDSDMPSYPSEEARSISYSSPLGYSCIYDPTVFVLDDTGDGENFSYQTDESLASPVYVSIQARSDMSAEELAEGLVLQSGMDGVETQDTFFGANGISAKCVYVEQEVNGVTQFQTFYAIPSGAGSLLVEIGGYVGMPGMVEHKLEEITGTFTLAG